MHVFLLGNGFDLNHNLPTKYINFLHTVRYLIDYYTPEVKTVDGVFGSEVLRKIDADIDRSYKQFSDIYKRVVLSSDRVQDLIRKAKENIWFGYFEQLLSKDLKWIDFECEIGKVIHVLSKKTKGIGTKFVIRGKDWDKVERYIFEKFDFYYKKTEKESTGFGKICEVKPTYLLETPHGSGNLILNREKVIGDLYCGLQSFAEMLKVYLGCFIDATTNELCISNNTPEDNRFFSLADEVFTFNYSKTFENLYNSHTVIHHIHGLVSEDIVLGVNPDQFDELESIDTSFIQFKKYYQRVFYGTDSTYLDAIESFLNSAKRVNDGIILHVVGHSLDATDKDIIQEVFMAATKIFVYYHDKNAVGSYIKNLVSIYGKTAFDEIRRVKELVFLELPSVLWK